MRNWAWREYRAFRTFRASPMIYLSQRTQSRKVGLSSLSSERSEAKSLRLCAFARDPDEAGHDDCARSLCGQPNDGSLAKNAKAQSRPETISQREAKSLRLCAFARDLDQAGHTACARFLPRAGLSAPLLYNKGRDLRDIAKNLQKLLQVSKIRAIFAKIFP